MKTGLLLSGALGASAFPFLNNPEALGEVLKTADVGNVLRDIMHSPEKRSLMTRQDYLGISKAQSNCGTRTCPTFDEKGTITTAYERWTIADIRQINMYPSAVRTYGRPQVQVTSEDHAQVSTQPRTSKYLVGIQERRRLTVW